MVVSQDSFNKTYRSAAETLKAFKNYLKAKELIDEHNQKYDAGEVTYRLHPNKFADLSEKDLTRISSGFHREKVMSIGRTISIISPGQLPPGRPAVDWRDTGCVTPVKDQGFFCNSCWAFSAVAGLEAHFSLRYQKNVSFSEQQLVDCAIDLATGVPACEGGSQGTAYAYVQDNGIETTDTYPYQEDVPHDDIYPCRGNSSNSVGRISGYYRLRPRDENTMKDFVSAIGPIIIAFNGSQHSFWYYEGGIYDDPDCKR